MWPSGWRGLAGILSPEMKNFLDVSSNHSSPGAQEIPWRCGATTKPFPALNCAVADPLIASRSADVKPLGRRALTLVLFLMAKAANSRGPLILRGVA